MAVTMVLAGAAQAQDFTTLKGHGGPIMDIAVTEQGQVVTGSFDNAVAIWDGRAPEWHDGHEAAVTVVLPLSDGRLVSGSDDFTIRLWNGETSGVLAKHQGKVTSLAVTEDGSEFASGSWDATVKRFASDGTFLGETDVGSGINSVRYSTDHKHIFLGTNRGTLLRYDREMTQAPLPLVKHGFGINEMVVTGDWIAYGAVDGGTRVVDPESGAALADVTLDRRPILAMAHHAASHQLAVGDGHGYIMMLDTRTWRITGDFRATRQGPVWALAFSNDGNVLHAGGLDDVVYSWPVALLGEVEPAISGKRSFLRDPATMSNGERQFARKCSICHTLNAENSRKAGPTLAGIFGRKAGTIPDYSYSQTLNGSDIIWTEDTIDALFDQGPDHYIPGSKMPMQVIAKAQDRADLIGYLKGATGGGDAE